MAFLSLLNSLPRSGRIVLLLGAMGIVTGTLGIRLAQDVSWVKFFDNLHWTSATVAAALLAWQGVRRADAESAKARGLFAIGLTGYAIGQLLWDVQAAVGYVGFPAPSDLFYLWLGPFITWGFLHDIFRYAKPSQRSLNQLDVVIISVAVITIVLAVYLPARGNAELLPLLTLMAYPATLLAAACTGWGAVLVLRLRPSWILLLFLLSLLTTALSWMKWNHMALDGVAIDGAWFNISFSVAVLMMGLGASQWQVRQSDNVVYGRLCGGMLRLGPLLTVVVSCLAIILINRLDDVPEIVTNFVEICTLAIILLAMTRQVIAQSGHEQLIQTQSSLALEQVAVHVSEERFRTLITATSQMVWTANAKGEVVEDIPTWRTYTGQSIVEIKGWGWVAALHPDDVERTIAIWQHAVATNTIYETEYRIRHYDGMYGHFSVRGVPIRNVDGSIREWVGTCTDITERKLALEDLARKREGLVVAQRIGGMGSFKLDFLNDSQSFSDELCIIFEIAPEHCSAEALLKVIHPGDRNTVNKAISAARKNKAPFEIEHRLLFADRRIKYAAVRCEITCDTDGTILEAAGTVQDITERVLVHEKIKRLEREFRSLADNLPDIVSRFDRHLRYTYVNPVIESATGMSPAMLLGKTHVELGLPIAVAKIWDAKLRRVFTSAKLEVFEFGLPDVTGKVRQYQAKVVPEFDPSGNMAAVLAIARDITTIRQVKDVLLKSEVRFLAITANVPGMVFRCYRRPGQDRLWFTYISDGAMNLLGVSPVTLQADEAGLLNLIVAEHRQEFLDSLFYSQTWLSLWNWNGCIVTPEGGEKWINVRATPRLQAGNLCVWDGFAMNVTDSKASEDGAIKSQKMLRDLSMHLENVREQERKHIAREIHDELGQVLTALRMDVSLARIGFGASNPELAQRLESMIQLVDRTIHIARYVTSSLRPAALDLGIFPALGWLVDEFKMHTGISCDLSMGEAEIMLSDTSATVVFRVLQESLTNIARHAEATRVEIIMSQAEDHLCFEVIDNGRGFEPHIAPLRQSFGLIGMRERVSMLRGNLSIDSAPGRGTRVRVCVPVT